MGIEERLSGGHPNSLGDTVAVVEDILGRKASLDELIKCYRSDDEVVRLRVSNAMKRIALSEKELLLPYLDDILKDISQIDQASTQWTIARLFIVYRDVMNNEQRDLAEAIMMKNLKEHQDWIVLNESMKSMTEWVNHHPKQESAIKELLERHTHDKRRSVSKTAQRCLDTLNRK